MSTLLQHHAACSLRSLLSALCFALSLLPAQANAASALPPPPAAAVSSRIADTLWLNGRPLQLTRILSSAPLPSLRAHYRHHFAGRLAEAEVGNSLILSSERGSEFFTITLKPVGADQHEILIARQSLQADTRSTTHSQAILPGDSELLAVVESTDHGQHATQYVFRNQHSLTANLTHLYRQLAGQQLRPTTSSSATQAPTQAPRQTPGQAQLEFFDGPEGAGQLLLMRRGAYTEAILTLIRRSP